MPEKLPVIFRKWPESEGGGIIALFPTELGTNDPYTCSSYESVGQHGSAEPVGLIQRTKPAKPSEYAGLLKELHQIGYRNLDIKERYQYSYLAVREKKLKELSNPAPTPKKVKKSVSRKSRRKSRESYTSLGGMR